jgi:hypothetical protein
MSLTGSGSPYFHFPAGGILPSPMVTATEFNAAQVNMVLNANTGGRKRKRSLAKSSGKKKTKHSGGKKRRRTKHNR